MSSLNPDILVDVFKELSRQYKNVPQHAQEFPKFYLSGKEPLKAAFKILPNAKSIQLTNSWIVVSFVCVSQEASITNNFQETFQWKITNGADGLPQIFWKIIAQNIQKLTVNYFDANVHMFLIKYLQNSESNGIKFL